MLTFLKACSRCCDGDSEEDSSEIRARLYEGYQNSEEEGSEYHQSGDESDLGSEEVSLLIMEAQNRRKKTYGTRASKTSTRANGIFGASPSASRSPLDELTESLANVQIKPTRPSPSPSSKISTLNLEGTSSNNDEDDIEPVANVVTKQSGDQPDLEDAINDLSTAIQEQLLDEVIDPVAEAVRPLQDVYEADRGESMMIMTWEEVLTGVTTIDKIAEASFAQVFRVTNKEGSSILKFIELKTPHDPASMRSETAASVETVVPEFRMMNALAEVPGFLNFKDAHVLMGKPTAIIQNAYDRFVERKQETVDEDFESWFPSPDSYSENAVFLALELGDAGTVLEDFDQRMDHDGCPMSGLGHVEWVWDILLGVIIALSRAEELYQFEHRDLHENNICVKLSKAIHDFPATVDDDEQPKLGRSGLEITILDYGLSRATLGGDEIYSDLEADLEVFQSESENGNKREDLQFNTYRRMRNHLFSGKYGLTSSAWHGEDSRKKNNGHSWNEYIPYTNVLWIGYIYEFLRDSFADDKLTKEQRRFRAETKELAGRLKPTPNNIYRFVNATDILQYALDQGWATTEQLEGYGVDTSIFADESESE